MTFDAADNPHRISTSSYQPYHLFGGTLETFHVTEEVERACRAGQTIGACESEPGKRVRHEWHALSNTIGGAFKPPVLYAETHRYLGKTPDPSTVDPTTGLAPPVDGDRRNHFVYNVTATGSTYRVLKTLTEAHEWDADTGEWVLFSHSKDIYGGSKMFKVASEGQLDASGTISRQERKFTATGLVKELTRPNQVARKQQGKSYASRGTVYDGFDLFPTEEYNELFRFDVKRDRATGKETYRKGPLDDGRGPYVKTRYDGFGRVVSRIRGKYDADTDSYEEVEVFQAEYHDGFTTWVETRNRVSYDSDTWKVERTYYDAFGRVIREEAETGAGLATHEYEYDAAGNVSFQRAPNPRESVETGTLAPVEYSYSYDSLGRIDTVTLPATEDGQPAVLKRTYDGRVQTRTQIGLDQNSVAAPVTLEKDVFGRVTKVIEAGPNGDAVTRYWYDAGDRVRKIVDADGIETILEHDFAGRRRKIRRGEQVWNYQYDRHGNVVSEVVPQDSPFTPLFMNTWAYDAVDRPTSVRIGASSADGVMLGSSNMWEEYFLDYDQGGVNNQGQLTTVTAPWGTTSFDYTSEGWVRSKTREISIEPSPGASFDVEASVTYEYDALGQITDAVYDESGADPVAVVRDYDLLGRPGSVYAESLMQTSPQPLAQFTRNRAGLVTARTSGADQSQTWAYDALGRVQASRVRAGQCQPTGACSSTVVAGEEVDYNSVGETWRQTDIPSGWTFQYDYDSQSQLVAVQSNPVDVYAASFSYSPAGRVLEAYVSSGVEDAQVRERDVLYEYVLDNPNGNSIDPAAITALVDRASGDEIAGYHYNRNGDRTESEVGTDELRYAYDARGRLRTAEDPDTGAREIYYYDRTGQRIAVYTDPAGSESPYLRHWFGALESRYDATGELDKQELYVSLGATPVARIRDGDVSNPDFTYHNGLRHLLAAVEADGQTVASFVYSPYGELLSAEGPEADTYRRRFNGKELDELTGLGYYGARYYDRLTLTWTQLDKLYKYSPDAAGASPRDAQLYAFSLNNPIRYLDPDGNQSRDKIEFKYQGKLSELVEELGEVEGWHNPGHELQADEQGYDYVETLTFKDGTRVTHIIRVKERLTDFQNSLQEQGISISYDTRKALEGLDIVLTVASGVGGIVRALGEKATKKAVGESSEVLGAKLTRNEGSSVAKQGDDGARFVVQPDGRVVDVKATPRGSYRQPDGSRTDVLQREDHGAGLSHTHEAITNTNPKTGETFVNGVSRPGRPVSADDVMNIMSGDAWRIIKGRQ